MDRIWTEFFRAGRCFHSCLVDRNVFRIKAFSHLAATCQGVAPVRRDRSRWYPESSSSPFWQASKEWTRHDQEIKLIPVSIQSFLFTNKVTRSAKKCLFTERCPLALYPFQCEGFDEVESVCWSSFLVSFSSTTPSLSTSLCEIMRPQGNLCIAFLLLSFPHNKSSFLFIPHGTLLYTAIPTQHCITA